MNRRKGQSGQAIVIMAGIILVLTMMGALVFDAALAMSDRRIQQASADAAALAGARSFGTGVNQGNWTAMEYLATPLGFSLPVAGCMSATACAAGTYTLGDYTVTLVDSGSGSFPTVMDVTINHQQPSIFARMFGVMTLNDAAAARSTYVLEDTPLPCVICLMDSGAVQSQFSMRGTGTLTLRGGDIHLNSTGTLGGGSGSAYISGGGQPIFDAGKGITVAGNPPTGIGTCTGCPAGMPIYSPVIADPLGYLPMPPACPAAINPCPVGLPVAGPTTGSVTQGVYTTLGSGSGVLNLAPGTYIITQNMEIGAGVTGTDVTLIFTCSGYPIVPCAAGGQTGATLTSSGGGSSVIHISAPRSGYPYNNIAIMFDRNNCGTSCTDTTSGNYGIGLTANVSMIVDGTIYAAKAGMGASGSGAYTFNSAVIVRALEIQADGGVAMTYVANQNGYAQAPVSYLVR